MRTLWRILRGTARRFASERLPLLAAAIAYYALFSFVPLVALLVAGLGMIWGSQASEARVIERVMQVLPLEPGREQNLVTNAIHAVVRSSRTMTAIGLIALASISIGVVGAVRGAIEAAWGLVTPSRFVHRRIVDLGLVIGFAVILLTSVAATTALHLIHRASTEWLGGHPALAEFMFSAAGWFLPGLLSFLAFLLVYRFVPQTRHGFADVWPTALLAAAMFELAKHGFALYVSQFSRFQALYGALGAVLLFLTWTYTSALILLVGAAFGSEYEREVRGIG